ncbi:hypothetical protein SALBM217S_06039 [Streptomyces griseoloalbus]
MPGSRTYLCQLDAITGTGALDLTNPACEAALNQSGATALYNNRLRRPRLPGRRTRPRYVPDGTLCSAGDRSPYDFSAYNAARSDWPRTHLTSGSTIKVQYSNWAAHPGDFRLYITEPGWSPTSQLKWDDLQLIQTVTNPPQQGSPGANGGHYYWNLQLPSGRHRQRPRLRRSSRRTPLRVDDGRQQRQRQVSRRPRRRHRQRHRRPAVRLQRHHRPAVELHADQRRLRPHRKP